MAAFSGGWCGFEWLAQVLHYPDPEQAYVAGLLHDIGKLLLDQAVLSDYAAIADFVQKYKMQLWQVEEKLIGIDHATTGGLIAEHWNFPVVLVDAIRSHHVPSFARINQRLPAIVNLANSFTEDYQMENSTLLSFQVHPESFNILKISPAELEKIKTKMINSDVSQIFQRCRPCLGNAPVCVTPAPGQALCALRATPEPACAALPSWGTACDGARKLRCERGFVTAEERCTGSCFMGSAGATCSVLASPDAACAASPSTPFASGSACADPTTRIDCDRGWRVASKVCTTTGGCQTVPTRRGTGTTGLCTVGVAADPRCLLDDPSSHEICGDGGSITCMEGYVVQELVCMGQQVCPSVGPTVCPGGILSSQGDPHGR